MIFSQLYPTTYDYESSAVKHEEKQQDGGARLLSLRQLLLAALQVFEFPFKADEVPAEGL